MTTQMIGSGRSIFDIMSLVQWLILLPEVFDVRLTTVISLKIVFFSSSFQALIKSLTLMAILKWRVDSKDGQVDWMCRQTRLNEKKRNWNEQEISYFTIRFTSEVTLPVNMEEHSPVAMP